MLVYVSMQEGGHGWCTDSDPKLMCASVVLELTCTVVLWCGCSHEL
jgi:hypothetical protein